ncbi:hypothetical protein [Paenibacillus sp. MMO-58]|uniref:hypothetical protein n=1 Tax=Paenibacillus sp. MMO-58 TaxID=3081290 RepID=UPI003019C6C2
MAKASAAYPNKAPDFRRNPQILELWVERLASVDAAIGLANLNRHIDSSNFFPDIADIVRLTSNEVTNLIREETQERFRLLAEWEHKATPMPLQLKRGAGE